MTDRVLHIDIDAFFATVEQLRNPRLEGHPVAVGSGVVASASYEARRFGIRAGTPLRKARELCPDLTILRGHASIYRCFSEPVFALCSDYSPSSETFLDEAYCDWSGMERLHPAPLETALELKRRIREETGLKTTAGIGRNRMLAKMASRSAKPDGARLLEPEEEESFLTRLSVEHLPGVGPRIEAMLRKLNVRTLGELRLLSRSSLRAMFGLPGLVLYDRCRGKDTQPISPREIPRSIRRETSFEGDTTERETIQGTLHYLTERAANTLRELHLDATRLGVKIRYRDFVEEIASRKLPAPTQLDSEIFGRALKLLDALYTRRAALRLVGMSLAGLAPSGRFRQSELFAMDDLVDGDDSKGGSDPTELPGATRIPQQRRELRLLESLDAIRRRYGYSAVVCGKSLHLLGKLPQDDHGFILRTPSLTR